MNLNKSLEFFNPLDVSKAVHVVGVGAMGSRVAELLGRLGVEKLHLWDMDIVESVNITNQAYTSKHIGMTKVDAMESILKDINPNIAVNKHTKWEQHNLSGYIFLCVDNIELRSEIATRHKDSPYVEAMFDTRMRLTDAQSYGAKWSNEQQKKTFINSMQFTSEEAQAATPVSACGTSLSVASTVVSTAAFTVANFINLIRTGECDTMIFTDAFAFTVVKY